MTGRLDRFSESQPAKLTMAPVEYTYIFEKELHLSTTSPSSLTFDFVIDIE